MDSEHSTPPYNKFVEQVPGRLHGRQLDTPIYAASEHSIRAKLHGDRPVKAVPKRNALIIQRANWATQLTLRLPASGFDRESFDGAVSGARRWGDLHLGLNTAPVYMPSIERLQDAFPSDETSDAEVIEAHRQRMNFFDRLEGRPPSNLLQRQLSRLRGLPVAGVLAAAFENAVQKHELGRISKIVAFGNHGVLFWDNDTAYLGHGRKPKVVQKDCLERTRMWSSLFLMRELLSAQGCIDSETPIYAQDTGFRDYEVKAWEKDGISVLCGAYGHQQGFVEIDHETMVVLFCPHINILGLIMEIDDPPLLFVNEHLQTSMEPLGVDREAAGYRLGEFESLEIPSSNIPVKYNRLFCNYAEVSLTSHTTSSLLPELQLSSRLFVRKRT